MLSPETVRLDATDELRWRSEGSGSSILRREDCAVRVEVERCGRSVLGEFAPDVLLSVSLAPCLERGGGGGDFAADKESLLLWAGLGAASMEG
jgi:hypothetical protein